MSATSPMSRVARAFMISRARYGMNLTDPSQNAKFAPSVWLLQKWLKSQGLSTLPGPNVAGKVHRSPESGLIGYAVLVEFVMYWMVSNSQTSVAVFVKSIESSDCHQP